MLAHIFVTICNVSSRTKTKKVEKKTRVPSELKNATNSNTSNIKAAHILIFIFEAYVLYFIILEGILLSRLSELLKHSEIYKFIRYFYQITLLKENTTGGEVCSCIMLLLLLSCCYWYSLYTIWLQRLQRLQKSLYMCVRLKHSCVSSHTASSFLTK